jgi:4-amino-4-deoxy-L-arabinose transferase-like glycosyltransferase
VVAIGLAVLVASAVCIGLGIVRTGESAGPGARVDLAVAVVVPVAIGGLVLAWPVGHSSGSAGSISPQLMAIIGGAVATGVILPIFVWVGQRWRAEPVPSPVVPFRVELVLVGVLVLVFGVTVGLGIIQNATFSWDESVYALIARSWLFGTPSSGWGPYRPPLLSFLATIPMLVTRHEAAFRAITLLFGCLCVVAVWLLGRRLQGALAGLLAAAVVAVAQPIEIQAGLFLDDVPSAGLVVLFLCAISWVMERPRAGRAMLWLAPIAALAFYLRYGSALVIALIAVTALVLWRRRIAADWRTAAATAALLVALLVPHFAYSTIATGTPWGIVVQGDVGARSAHPGAAFAPYLALLPYGLMGPLGAVIAVIGLLAGTETLVRAFRIRRLDASARAMALLLLPAVGSIIVLGIEIHPEPRYLFLEMILLIVAGSMSLEQLWGRLRSARAPIGWIAAALMLIFMAGSAATISGAAAARGVASAWLRSGGRLIEARSSSDCSVLASDVPLITWYSGCRTLSFGAATEGNRDRLLTGRNRWLIVRKDGEFQPLEAIVADYIARTRSGPRAALHDARGVVRAILYQFP